MFKNLIIASTIFVASCTSVKTKPQLKKCNKSFESLNDLYTLVEPFYGVNACSEFNPRPIYSVLEVVNFIKRNSLECTEIIDNIEDVADPVLDYVKRSIFHIDSALENINSNIHPTEIERLLVEMQSIKFCYTQLDSIRVYYKLNGLDFGVHRIVYDYLLDKIHEIDSLLVNSNFIFCTE